MKNIYFNSKWNTESRSCIKATLPLSTYLQNPLRSVMLRSRMAKLSALACTRAKLKKILTGSASCALVLLMDIST